MVLRMNFWRAWARRTSRDERGSILVFVMMVFSAMFLVGGAAVDLSRHENLRSTLQYNLDRAVLAAASLKQSETPQVIVEDYMSKVITIENFTVNVENQAVSVNSRSVEATATAILDTWFLSMAGIHDMPIRVRSAAEERIPELEISLVLDVSGSMAGAKLTNLKTAAKQFVTTMLANVDPDSTSISVVPFNHNVAPSLGIYNNMTVDEIHKYSACLTISDADFSNTFIDPNVSQKQTIFTSSAGGWQSLDGGRKTCYSQDYFEILPFQQNETVLHTKIDSLQADGWTSAHMGMKWGMALLDPKFQPIVTQLITDLEVDAGFAGLPVAYTDPDTLKIVVLMGDGANTWEFIMPDAYRGSNSDLFEVTYQVQEFQYAYHKNKVWKTSTSESKCGKNKWVCVYDTVDETDFYLRDPDNNEYLDIDDDNWISQNAFDNLPSTLTGWTNTKRLSWAEAWGQMPTNWYGNETGNWVPHNNMWGGTSRSMSEADALMTDACTAARNTGIVTYTIGYQTNSTTSSKLRACATNASLYYDANTTNITQVFSSIAASIQKLKLTQ